MARYFTSSDQVKQLFFSVSDSNEVPRATRQIREVLQSRHRPESVYRVDNLTQLLTVAAKYCEYADDRAAADLDPDSDRERCRHHEHHCWQQ